MKSKTMRILVVAVCSVVLIAEAILMAVVFGGKSPAKAKERTSAYYRVKRTVRCVTSDGTREYHYDRYGRIREILSEGMIRFTLPYFNSNFGTSRISCFYDASGKLIRIHHVSNESEWDDAEDVCEGIVWVTDSHGGVSTAYISDFYGGWDLYGMNLEANEAGMLGETEYSYDEDGRIIKRILKTGDTMERQCFFQYDEEGNLIRRTDTYPTGEVVRICWYEYDDCGRLIHAKVSGKGSADRECSFEYDARGNRTRVSSFGNEFYARYEITSTFDADGYLIESIRTESGGTAELIERREYETILVKEEYLTDSERKELGLSYDPDRILEEKQLINPMYWCFTDDFGIMY
ncbi:MAG: RHS repeat protein [Lachnospiraceae bacterium]|nr:RHS repeat protein [Lachnospiraceae bacterium]